MQNMVGNQRVRGLYGYESSEITSTDRTSEVTAQENTSKLKSTDRYYGSSHYQCIDANNRKAAYLNTSNSVSPLSNIDQKILRSLLSSGAEISSYQLSKELSVPLTTIHRRRKKLETAFLNLRYFIKIEKFGWHQGTFLVFTTGKGPSSTLGKQFLSLSEVISVQRTVGYRGANWLLEVIYPDNKGMADLIEKIKSLEGVGEIIWMEQIEKLQKPADDYCQLLTMRAVTD
jgi:DNA-binding Lrp family transcriptional regulator